MLTASFLLTQFIIFISFFSKAISGFGMALIAVPFLTFFYDFTVISPFINFINFFTNLMLIAYVYKHIHYRILVPIVLGSLLGSFIGIHFLAIIQNESLLVWLGVIILITSFTTLAQAKFSLKANDIVGFFVGVLAGTLSALYSIGGPPLVIYLAAVIKEKAALRATIIAFFITNALTQIPLFGTQGFLTYEVGMLTLTCLPIAVLAQWVGNKVHNTLSASKYRLVVFCVLVCSSVVMIFR